MKRTCKKCKIEKDITEFAKCKDCLYGYSHKCKSCDNLRSFLNRKKNPDRENKRVRDHNKKRAKEDPEYWSKRYQRYKEIQKRNIKRYREKNPEKPNEWQKAIRKKDPRKMRANNWVNYNLRCGNIQKAKICQRCNIKADKIDAHHEDYDKPKEIIWLCRTCHAKADRLRKVRENEHCSSILPRI